MKTVSKKMIALSLTLAMAAPLAVGCTKAEKADNQNERVLKIAMAGYGGDEEYIRQQFTEVFEFANPKIKIEVVPAMDDKYRYGGYQQGEKMPDPLEKLKEVMQGANPPDVVIFDFDKLSALVDNNLLTQLDPQITKDKFDTAGIVPTVIDGIKGVGGGKLYGLAPNFNSSALVYNKKMFTDAGVDFPKDDMTWDEMFDLAKRVAKGQGESKISGFSFFPQPQIGLAYGLQNYYIPPLQLRMVDDAGEKMTVDSDQWEKIWTKMAQLQKQNVFPDVFDPQSQSNRQYDPQNPFSSDDFMSGRLAMTTINYGQVKQIENANKNAASYKGYTPIDWDVVTIPSHPEAKGVGGALYMNSVMGINAKAQNPDDAWKFIKFINSDDWAKLKSHSSYDLVSRSKYVKPKDGQDFHIEAFYKISPAPADSNNKLYYEKPYIYQVYDLGREYLDQVLKGTKTAREGLKEWQAKGDAMLKQMKDNPNQPPTMSSGVGR